MVRMVAVKLQQFFKMSSGFEDFFVNLAISLKDAYLCIGIPHQSLMQIILRGLVFFEIQVFYLSRVVYCTRIK